MWQIEVWDVYMSLQSLHRELWAEGQSRQQQNMGPLDRKSIRRFPLPSGGSSRSFVPHSELGLTYTIECMVLSLHVPDKWRRCWQAREDWGAPCETALVSSGSTLCDPQVTCLSQNTVLTKEILPGGGLPSRSRVSTWVLVQLWQSSHRACVPTRLASQPAGARRSCSRGNTVITFPPSILLRSQVPGQQ